MFLHVMLQCFFICYVTMFLHVMLQCLYHRWAPPRAQIAVLEFGGRMLSSFAGHFCVGPHHRSLLSLLLLSAFPFRLSHQFCWLILFVCLCLSEISWTFLFLLLMLAFTYIFGYVNHRNSPDGILYHQYWILMLGY